MAAVMTSNSTIVRSSKPSSEPRLLRAAMAVGSLLAPELTGRRAEALFTSPLRSSRERALSSPLQGARVEYQEVAGERIAVYRWGDADRPLLLFSHGWSSFGLRVLPWLTRLLASGYQVASFDQVAHGRSSGRHATLPGFGDVLAGVADRLGPVDAMVGHSLGGAAVAMALHRGVSARRVALIAPPADAAGAVNRFAQWVGLGSRALQHMRSAVVARAGVPLEQVTAQTMAPALGTPALIVHDLADAEVPWSHGERYARYWPEARLLSVEGLGHHRVVTDATVIDAVTRFLGGESLGETVVSTTQLPYGVA